MTGARPMVRDATRISLVLAGLSLAAALGASELEVTSTRGWVHGFAVSLLVTLAIAAPLGTVLIVARRDRGDGMPVELWRTVEPDRGADKLIFRASPAHQVTMPAFVICLAFAAPFLAIGAYNAGRGATIFVTAWVLALGFGCRSWWRSSSIIRLCGDDLGMLTPGGAEKHVSISRICSIRWPAWGAVTIRYDGGILTVPRRIENLDEVVVELRRRNHNISFDGKWPPK